MRVTTTTPISSHIKLLEQIFPTPKEDATLREMIRTYCKSRGYYSQIDKNGGTLKCK